MCIRQTVSEEFTDRQTDRQTCRGSTAIMILMIIVDYLSNHNLPDYEHFLDVKNQNSFQCLRQNSKFYRITFLPACVVSTPDTLLFNLGHEQRHLCGTSLKVV